MMSSLSPFAIVTVAALLAIPGLGLTTLLLDKRTSLATRLALILPLGYGTIALVGFPLALLHIFVLPTIASAWAVASVAIWIAAIKSGRVRPTFEAARISLIANPWRLATAALLFGWYAVIRWSYQPLVNFAPSPLRYWADGVEIADAHGIPAATLQYGRLLAPTVSKVFFNVFQGGLGLTLGRAPLAPMAALLFVVSLGLALLVFAFATDLGLRWTAPIVVLLVVASPKVPMSLGLDLNGARAENWGRLAAIGALLLFFRVLDTGPGPPRRRLLIAAGALLGVAAATHLVAAVAVGGFATAYVLARLIVDRSGRRDFRRLVGFGGVAAVIAIAAFLLPHGDLGFEAASGDASYAALQSRVDLPAGVDPSLFIITDGRPDELPPIPTGPGHYLSWLSSVMQGRDPIADPASPIALALPALLGLLAMGVLLRQGNPALRRVAIVAAAFAAILIVTGIAFALRYHSFALSNFGNRRLIDYLAIPTVMLVAGLLELAAGFAGRKLRNGRSLGALSFAVVFLSCLAILPRATADLSSIQPSDIQALQWIATHVPCEGRILADRRTVATFESMTGHAGVVEGMGPHIRPDVLTYAIEDILGAQQFFANPSEEYLRANGVAAVVVTTPAYQAIGGWNRFSDVDPATLENLPFLQKSYEGPSVTVFTVPGFEPNPALPSVAGTAGYNCSVPSSSPATSEPAAQSPLDQAAHPWNGTTFLSPPGGHEETSEPRLSWLQITGAKVQWRPTFDPQIFRYAIYAPATATSVTITAEPSSPADRMTIDGRAIVSGKPTTFQLPPPGHALSIDVTGKSGRVRTYELLRLPPDFPILNVSKIDPSAAAQGPLYLAVNSDPHSCDPPEQACWIMTIDEFGVPIFYRRVARWASDFKLQPSGQRSYTAILGTQDPPYATAVILGRKGSTRQLTARGFRRATNAHDFLMLPGDRRVFLAYAPGSARTRDGSAVDVVNGVVQEQRGSHVVFRWDSGKEIPLSDSVRPPPDYLHLNSVAVDQANDFIVSARGTSQIYDIDRGTASINWRLGGTSSDFRFVGDPYDGFCGQHSAVPLPNHHILIFDNGQAAAGWSSDLKQTPVCPPGVTTSGRGLVSRAVEYALDQRNGTARMVWSYDGGTYAPSQGSVQRLANGNTLIGWGVNDSGLLASEVTAEGRPVFEISGTWPDGTAVFSYRALRFLR